MNSIAAAPREWTVEWSTFNNETENKTPIPGAAGLELPSLVAQAEPGS
jgi:hypothetical protein